MVMAMQTAEVEFEPLDAGHVQARVDDWAARIDRLYADLTAWLPPGYRAEVSQGVTMNEMVMREYGVPPRRLPVLSVFEGGDRRAKVIPFGLWVIGADGRLDMLSGSGKHVLIGRPRDAEGLPEWRIASAEDRWTPKDLDRQSWSEALR